jgi:hypothetical protein
MKWLALAAALALAGCHEGNDLALTPPVADLAEVPDLLPPPDMVPPPNCGKIVFCALGCLGGGLGGLGGGGSVDGGGLNLGCVLGCAQNAPPAQVSAALSLVACAAQSCLQNGTSGGGLGIFQCLSTSCPSQLSMCQGLGSGM